jgi:hypothetical protein
LFGELYGSSSNLERYHQARRQVLSLPESSCMQLEGKDGQHLSLGTLHSKDRNLYYAAFPEINAALAKTPNKHKTPEGLREIIQQERRIEMAFEGHRNFDVRRWKQADKYFNIPVTGWSVDGSTTNTFYIVKTVGQRSFITPRDYLHPIKYSEMIVNSNLVQSPGW